MGGTSKKKYDTEEARAKIFAVSHYLKYQMIDDKSIEAQSHELQKIAHEIMTEEGMFKLNVDVNKVNISAYMICSFNIWHSRLCHINKRLVKNMSSLGLIPKLPQKDFEKCESYSQAKITKSPHKYVIRVSELLDLFHYDICEFEGILTRNGKRYFIDDCSNFSYVLSFEEQKSSHQHVQNLFKWNRKSF